MNRTHTCYRRFVWSAILLSATMAIPGRAAPVTADEAAAIATLWLKMELNSSHLVMSAEERTARLNGLNGAQLLCLLENDELVATPPQGAQVLAYVVIYAQDELVVVTADDRLEPVLVFNVQSPIRLDRQEPNFLRDFLKRNLAARWSYLRVQENRGVVVPENPNWAFLRLRLSEGNEDPPQTDLPSIYILWDTALWNQSPYYNDEVIVRNGNTAGIPTGCTATAIAIKLRFHTWPATGNGSHSYTDSWGTVQHSHSVNFGAETFTWANMPATNLTSANTDVAELMYDCGVSVNMDYEVGSSAAWPSASTVNSLFRYRGTIERTSSHDTPIIASVRGGLPVVISSSAHTVVVAGYRDSVAPYYYLNCGWGGSNNMWYNLDNMPGGDATIDRSYPYSAPSNYVYVAGSWTGSENGNIQNPYNTLVEGNAAVPSGGQLWLKAGGYTGATTFATPLTICSYEGTATIAP